MPEEKPPAGMPGGEGAAAPGPRIIRAGAGKKRGEPYKG